VKEEEDTYFGQLAAQAKRRAALILYRWNTRLSPA